MLLMRRWPAGRRWLQLTLVAYHTCFRSDRYGFIVPVGDQRALEAALGNALAKTWDRDAIAKWGQKRSWYSVAEDVMRVFQDAIQTQNPPKTNDWAA